MGRAAERRMRVKGVSGVGDRQSRRRRGGDSRHAAWFRLARRRHHRRFRATRVFRPVDTEPDLANAPISQHSARLHDGPQNPDALVIKLGNSLGYEALGSVELWEISPEIEVVIGPASAVDLRGRVQP